MAAANGFEVALFACSEFQSMFPLAFRTRTPL